MSANESNVNNMAKAYYDSPDADNFYYHVWGGEDIHIGIYDTPGISVTEASRLTVELMKECLGELSAKSRVIDIGSGYGGAASYLAQNTGCSVSCANISKVENDRNRAMSKQKGLDHLIEVFEADFEDLPFAEASFDFAWSQDALLHGGNREQALAEIYRVLKPGGEFVFTDPMQSDHASPDELELVLKRIHLKDLGSFAAYEAAALKLGFQVIEKRDLTPQLIMHYQTINAELLRKYDKLLEHCSQHYLDRMSEGLTNWVNAGNRGQLAWGIIHLKKPR